VWVSVCVGVLTNNCVGVLVIRVIVFTVLCTVCSDFVLFRLCIFILICFVCTSVRTTATEWKLKYSSSNNNNNNKSALQRSVRITNTKLHRNQQSNLGAATYRRGHHLPIVRSFHAPLCNECDVHSPISGYRSFGETWSWRRKHYPTHQELRTRLHGVITLTAAV